MMIMTESNSYHIPDQDKTIIASGYHKNFRQDEYAFGEIISDIDYGRRIREGDRLLNVRYIVESILHENCDVILYKCRDFFTDSIVVIKAIGPWLRENEKEGIIKHFGDIRNLVHPNIATFLTLEKNDAAHEYFLIREYIEGEDLESLLRHSENERLPIPETVRLLRQVAEALDYAHDRGVLHRAVRCSNIIVTSNGDAKLIDFLFGENELGTQPDQSTYPPCFKEKDHDEMNRKWEYKSPEQWDRMLALSDLDIFECTDEEWTAADAKGKTTPATDEYSLAVVAYRCLAGHTPFGNAQGFREIGKKTLNDAIPRIKSLSRASNAVLAKALSKKPEDRYASCQEFMENLETALKPGGLSRWWQNARRMMSFFG